MTEYKKIFKRIPKVLRLPLMGLVVFSVLLIGGVVFLEVKLHKATVAAVTAQDKIQSVIHDVDMVVILPKNETPTVATIADPEKLKGQPFFAQAEIGDQILIYQIAKKAILWRPSVKKVVEISLLSGAVPTDNSSSTTKK